MEPHYNHSHLKDSISLNSTHYHEYHGGLSLHFSEAPNKVRIAKMEFSADLFIHSRKNRTVDLEVV